MGVSQNLGYLIGGPYNKDSIILGSIFGPLILRNYHMKFSNSALGVAACLRDV